jgi:hypothetical protein
MRLQEISMLVGSFSLALLAIGALVAALRPASSPVSSAPEEPSMSLPLPPIEVSVMNPDRPLPPIEVSIAPPESPLLSADDRFKVVPLPGFEGQTCAFVVQRCVPNPVEPGEPRWTLTFYSLDPTAPDATRLRYLGSRCVEYDMGADLMGLDSEKHYDPRSLRKALERAKKD